MEMQLAIVIYVVFIMIGRFLSQSQRRHIWQKPSSQWKSITKDYTAIFSILSMVIAVGLALIEAALREEAILQIKLIIVGMVIMLLGWVIAFLANREIGANWSPIIEKTPKQELVTANIYSFVRHPLYLSGLCILFGTNLYFGSKWAWIGSIIAIITIIIRIPIEEKKLQDRFGEEYTEYKQKTKALIPWLY